MLEFLHEEIKSFLPEERARWIAEFLEAGEWGVALELMLEYRSEYNLSVTDDFWNAARHCCEDMRIDIDPYL